MTLGVDDGLFIFAPVFSELSPEKKKQQGRVRRAAPELQAKKRPLRVDSGSIN
jgi:hypothetical protein